MPDPSDPRMAAINNIQASSRAYGRSRRRGLSANEDPAFRAAMEIADPEQRRVALAQYARQRAAALFPEQSAQPTGRDIVQQAFPSGDAFAQVQRRAPPMPSQADVMGQMPPMHADAAADSSGMDHADMAADMAGAPHGDAAMDQAAIDNDYQDIANEMEDTRVIEGRNKADPRYAGRPANEENTIRARRRR